jgi:hypothetical protein
MKLSFMTLSICALSVGAAAAPVQHSSHAATAKPTTPERATLPPRLYDFKGVPLEISIADFRMLPHPDNSPSQVVCTGEKVGDRFPSEPINVILFDETERKMGVIKCVWIDTSDGYFKNRQAALSLADSGYAAYDYSFYFIKDPKDDVIKLYKFEGTSNGAAMSSVTNALIHKFGAPWIENGKVQNKIGNNFDQTTAIWSNKLPSLLIQDRYLKIDDMGIVMTDTRLAGLISDEKAREAAAKPNAI